MAERYVEIEGRRVRVGDADDAGRLYVTDKSPDGISGSRYRWRVKYQSAPPPLTVPNPLDPAGGPVLLRNPVTGRQEYDLDAAEADATTRRRPGFQAEHTSPETLHVTPVRRRLLVAAGDGELAVAQGRAPSRRGAVLIGGVAQDRPTSQAFTALRQVGLLGEPVVPDDGGWPRSVALTDAGRAALTRSSGNP